MLQLLALLLLPQLVALARLSGLAAELGWPPLEVVVVALGVVVVAVGCVTRTLTQPPGPPSWLLAISALLAPLLLLTLLLLLLLLLPLLLLLLLLLLLPLLLLLIAPSLLTILSDSLSLLTTVVCGKLSACLLALLEVRAATSSSSLPSPPCCWGGFFLACCCCCCCFDLAAGACSSAPFSAGCLTRNESPPIDSSMGAPALLGGDDEPADKPDEVEEADELLSADLSCECGALLLLAAAVAAGALRAPKGTAWRPFVGT